ncbi:hypothetical protein FQZ97_462140 [compost metagenome]
MRASAFGTTAFSAFAPRLPPTTSSFSGPLRPAKRSAGAGCEVNAARSGLPTHCAFFSTFGKAVNTRSATPASTLLARPATEFCSCSTSGLPISTPIIPPGKVM